ncbi:hypothetical protein ACVU7I_13980, partial [Patulibacter sp. S7RM1-6]
APPAAAAATPTLTCWKPTRQTADGGFVTPRRVVRRPRTCSTLGPTDPFAAAVDLHRLRWSSYGARRARARGSVLSWHLDRDGHRSRVPATVVASGVSTGRGRRWFSRLRVTTRYGSSTIHLRAPWAAQRVAS